MAKRSRTPVDTPETEQTPASPPPEEAALTATPAEAAPEVLTTGLEDYGRWLVMFQNCPRDENEPPFRRGRIWA